MNGFFDDFEMMLSLRLPEHLSLNKFLTGLAGIDKFYHRQTSLHIAYSKGISLISHAYESDFRIFVYLYEQGAKYEFKPITEKPKFFENDIFIASQNGDLPSVQWLIEQYKKKSNNSK